MKILIAHNYYQEAGGEDTIFLNEINLLRKHGHQVIEYTEHNERIKQQNIMRTAFQSIWSFHSYKKITEVIDRENPDIAYFFNTFPLFSPSIYYACKRKNIPVIQVLANPRYICPKATLYRNEKLCLSCLGKYVPWPGIIYRCYHNSFLQTAIISAMLTFHKIVRTWQKKVDVYFVATRFYIDLYAKAGLPKEKLVLKPHYSIEPYEIIEKDYDSSYVLFVGRLDPEKGIRTLLNAWKNLDIPLKIRGDGRLEKEVGDFIKTHECTNFDMVERLSSEDLLQLMKDSRFLVWPSEGYYETFGMVVIESYMMGIPVLASDIGVMSEIVKDRKTGILFSPGDVQDLAQKAKWMWDNPQEVKRLGQNARLEFETKYTAEKNYLLLERIFESLIT